MNRYDAYALPMRDLFSGTLRDDKYIHIASGIPIAYVQDDTSSVDALISSGMDFSGPDRNPLLGEIVWKSLTGAYPPGSSIQESLRRGTLPEFPGHR
jgi:hypothetical protein